MTVDDVEFEAELLFHHEVYYVFVRETKATLSIEAERKNDGCRWRGDFTSRYIEEITQRVGNLKNFKTFVEMIKSAFLRKSTALHVDLLTYHDLEKLTMRRGANDSHSTFSGRALASDKRYLILTYITEFDRVHYPLPLIYEEDADPVALKRCIQRLRSEVDYMKARVRKSEAGSCSRDIAAKNSDQDVNICQGDLMDKGGCNLDDLTAHKRTIMKLMKKNSMLVDQLRGAKEAEQSMSTKIQDQAFEISLLKRRLSMRGGRDVSPAPYRNMRDISPVRSKPRLTPENPHHRRPRLGNSSPSSESRSSSASRKLASPSLSSLLGSRSSSCPRFHSKSASVPNSPRQKPLLYPKRFPTKVTNSLPAYAKDGMRDRSPMPPRIKVPRPFSSSSNDSSENFQAKLLSHKRAEDEKSNRKTPPFTRKTHAKSVGVEDIDSRLYALCNFLKSSHGR